MRSPRASLSRRSPTRRAAALVEFALVCLPLFVIVLGIIEVGRYLMVMHLLNNAARIGCRTAILGTTTTNAQVSAAVLDNLDRQSVTGLDASAVTIQVRSKNGTVSNDVSKAEFGDEISVRVAVPFGQISWVPGARSPERKLSGQCSLRRE